MSYWLRLYTGILDDPKVQRLAPEYFKGWVNLLCLAKENDGLLPAIEDIAFRLRIEDAQAEELIKTLKARGLLDEAGGDLTPHNWASRQYETEETASNSQKGALGNHKRWHVGRGIIADDCPYCRGDIGANRSDIAATSQRHRGESPGESSRAEAEQRQRAETETEAEQQSRGRAEAEAIACPPAAAASDFETHLSAFARDEIEDFVRETKPHIKNVGGFARTIWRSGVEDEAIGRWKAARDEPLERHYPKWVYDPKEPGSVEEKKLFHDQLCENQRRIEAEFQQEAASDAA
jgi:hypothetical protein